MQKIIGHIKQRQALAKLVFEKSLPSALLLTGIPGVGKSLVAREIASNLACLNLNSQESLDSIFVKSCQNCPNCKTFNVGNFPDFYCFDCSGDFDTDNLKDLLSKLQLKAFSGQNRIIILQNCESLSIQASNALLKSLEEPRPNTYFILTTNNSSQVIPTIISRCQVWHFDNLSTIEVTEILKENSLQAPAQISLAELALLADGSCQNIQNIIEHVELWLELKQKLTLVFQGRLKECLDLANQIGKDKENLKLNLSLMRIFTRLKMHQSLNDDDFTISTYANFLLNLISAESLIFENNLNPVLVLSNIFIATSDQKQVLTHNAPLLENFVLQ